MCPVIDWEAGVHIGSNSPSAGTDLIIWFLLLMLRSWLGVGGILFQRWVVAREGLWIQARQFVNSEGNFPLLALGYLVF